MKSLCRTMLATLSILLSMSASLGVDLSSQGLTDIPWSSVPDTDTQLRAKNNQLVTVTPPPTGKILQMVDLSDNQIANFPDLYNIRTTLTQLFIKNNQIRAIEPASLLTQLAYLGQLYIDNNLLVALPSADQFPLTLSTLSLLSNSLLRSFPNACFLNTTLRVQNRLLVSHLNNDYHCGPAMLWTKLAMDRGVLFTFMKPTCTSPSGLVGTAWDGIAIDDFLDEDNMYFTKMEDTASFRCFPNITDSIPNMSNMACGMTCLKRHDCAMYAMEGSLCVLTQFTEGAFGSDTDFLKYKDWFYVQ